MSIKLWNAETQTADNLIGSQIENNIIDDTTASTDKVYSSSKVESNISEYISLSKNIYTADKTAGLLEYARKYYKLDNTKRDYLVRAYSTDGDYCIITIPFKYGEYYDSYNRAHSTTMYPTAWNVQGTVAFNKDIEKIEVIPMSRLESENYYKQLTTSDEAPSKKTSSGVIINGTYINYIPTSTIVRIRGYYYGGLAFDAVAVYGLFGGNYKVNYEKEPWNNRITITVEKGNGITVKQDGADSVRVVIEEVNQ